MDRGVLDRLLLHTGTLASIYHQSPEETFIRNAKPKEVHSSPALDPTARQSFLETLNLPRHMPSENVITTPTTSTSLLPSPPPALPPKPTLSTETGRNDDLLDEKEEDDLDSPEMGRLTAHQMTTDDPYASLAGLSDDQLGNLGRAFKEEEAERAFLS